MDDEGEGTTAATMTVAETSPEVVVVDFPTCPSCGGQTLDTEIVTLKILVCCLCGWQPSEPVSLR